jgi:DNA polymerase I-like protein with 3'-5' exonuclease and polymerase domains
MIEKPKPLLLPFDNQDYQAQEPRVMANYSQDDYKKQLAIYKNLVADVHAIKAAELFNKPVEQITSAQRFLGKQWNYSRLYGEPHKILKDKLDNEIEKLKND